MDKNAAAVIGALIALEKYKFADKAVIAEVVRDTVALLKDQK